MSSVIPVEKSLYHRWNVAWTCSKIYWNSTVPFSNKSSTSNCYAVLSLLFNVFFSPILNWMLSDLISARSFLGNGKINHGFGDSVIRVQRHRINIHIITPLLFYLLHHEDNDGDWKSKKVVAATTVIWYIPCLITKITYYMTMLVVSIV